MNAKTEKIVIGGLEDVALPDWGIGKIRARVDTGARTSAIHVERMEMLSSGRVAFDVVLGWKGPRKTKRVIAKIKKFTSVRPSTGQQQVRLYVTTTMRLGPITRTIHISLADRKRMTFRMLLGRSALKDDFLVSPAHHCLLSSPGKRKELQ